MDTPIFNFVKQYKNSGFSRLHMPGHKGLNLLGCESLDITEISGADSLYEANGIIAQSEKNATELFGSKQTFYSAEGSSLCVKSMLYIALKNSPKTSERNYVIAGRNAHKTFLYACATLDVDVQWVNDENSSICTCNVTAQQIESNLNCATNKPFAVYLTTPDYLGNIVDIKEIAKVCNKYNVPLLVDNAHGAYLRFLEQTMHPINLGAAMCCDSAHKTLPVITGGAYLHFSKSAPQSFIDCAKDAMSFFGSTSPSYLILQSLDLCNKYLSDNYCDKLKKCISEVDKLKNQIISCDYEIIGNEPLKLCVKCNGLSVADLLRINNIECEYADYNHLVLMFTPNNSKIDFKKISNFFSNIKFDFNIENIDNLKISIAKQAMSVRNAIMSLSENVDVDLSVGRICSTPTVSCPPAIPIAVSGEIISEEMVLLFKKYNIKTIQVVAEN